MLPALLSRTEAARAVGVCSEHSAAAATSVVRLDVCCWAPHIWMVEPIAADVAVRAKVDSCLDHVDIQQT